MDRCLKVAILCLSSDYLGHLYVHVGISTRLSFVGRNVERILGDGSHFYLYEVKIIVVKQQAVVGAVPLYVLIIHIGEDVPWTDIVRMR